MRNVICGMKQLLFLTIAVPLIFSGCNNTDTSAPQETNEPIYDSTLANELGADDYGMKQYVMAFLVAGPNRSQDPEEAAGLQRAHLDNISRMAEEGKLVLAGPFMDTGRVRGIYIFNTNSLEEAENWTSTDPAIEAGRLKMELHPWYGSATLPLIQEWHPKVQQKGI